MRAGYARLRLTRQAAAALLVGFALGGPLAISARAQEAPPAPRAFSLERLGSGVYSALAIENSGFVIGAEGVLVVDTFSDISRAELLLQEIRKLTALPIKYVVNTHYHVDHVGGNAVFTNAGALVIGHRGLGRRLSENLKFFGADPPQVQRARIDALVPPQLEFEGQMTIQLGGLEVQLFTLPGHTGTDTVVLVPQASVLFTGDLFWCDALPNMIDGRTDDWIASLDALAHEPRFAAKTVVPGHGGLGDKTKVGEFRDYLTELTRAVDAGRRAGQRGEALTDSVQGALAARYGSWLFPGLLKSNLEHVISEKAARAAESIDDQ